MEKLRVESVLERRRTRAFSFHTLLILLLPILFLPTASFTEVSYVCFTRKESTLFLECPLGSKLKIIEAKHGRNKWDTCAFLQGADSPDECSQISLVVNECCGRDRCNISVTPVFMPSCGYSSSFLRVIQECVRGTNLTCHSGVRSGNEQLTNGTSITSGGSATSAPIPADGTRGAATSVVPSSPDAVKSSLGRGSHSTTIDPDWLAKINSSTEWNGERNILVNARPQSYENDGDASLTVVWVCLAIALTIIGSLIALLLYVWRRKMMQEETSESNETLDNNNHPEFEMKECKTSQNSPTKLDQHNPAFKSSPPRVDLNASFQSTSEPRIIRTASRRYSSMRELQNKDFSVFSLPDPTGEEEPAPSRLNRTLSMTSFVLSDTLTRKRKSRDGDIQLVVRPNTEPDPV